MLIPNVMEYNGYNLRGDRSPQQRDLCALVPSIQSMNIRKVPEKHDPSWTTYDHIYWRERERDGWIDVDLGGYFDHPTHPKKVHWTDPSISKKKVVFSTKLFHHHHLRRHHHLIEFLHGPARAPFLLPSGHDRLLARLGDAQHRLPTEDAPRMQAAHGVIVATSDQSSGVGSSGHGPHDGSVPRRVGGACLGP